MSESLRRLVNIGSFTILQDKLEKWLDDYHVNTCDQNVARCCEVVELNSRIQAQLFKLLSLSSAEGGTYGGAAIIKSRLLPWLSSCLTTGVMTDTPLTLLSEVAAKDRELNDAQCNYERNLQSLESNLQRSRIEADGLRQDLQDTRDELDISQRKSTSDKMFTESETRELRTQMDMKDNEICTLRSRAGMVDNYEHQIRNLRDEVDILSTRPSSYVTDLPPRKYTTALSRSSSPFAIDDVTQRVKQQSLITRFNDMFSGDRLDAMDTLRAYCDNEENNQRIVFTAMQDAFVSAKQSFAKYKLSVRSNVALTHTGPETLEEATQEYINRNADLFDLPTLVADVIRSLNRNRCLDLPGDVSYAVIQPFVREAAKLAWNMTCLARPMDLAVSADGELFEDSKYRRSYDSEFSAPLVSFHIWPCLQQGLRVIMKGECCTKRGGSSRRSRSASRGRSPCRAISPSRKTASGLKNSRLNRSPSPRRLTVPGSSVSDCRSRSRVSNSPSRAITASTNLSHYGVRS